MCLGLPLFICWWWFGELGGYPTNDDPFYGRPAQILADESRFQMVTQAGELSASSVAHVLIGGGLSSLLGFSYRTLYLAVILQLWVGGWALYAGAREEGCSRCLALMWGAVFVINPLSFAHAFTFMTDAPAMSWGMLSLYLYRRGLRQSSSLLSCLKWFAVGSLAVAVAFWMRQTHVLFCGFPVASLTLLWYRNQITLGHWCWGVLASLFPAALAVLLFESGWLVFGDGLWGEQGRLHVVAPQGFDWYQTAINIYGLGILLGFLMLPLLPVLMHRWLTDYSLPSAASPANKLWTRPALWMAMAAGLLWTAPLLATQGRACLTSATGSVIANAHFGPIFLSDFEVPERWGDMGSVTWPQWVWVALTAAAIVNLTALLGCLLGCLRGCLLGCLRGWRSAAIDSCQRSTVDGIVRQAANCGLVATAIPIILAILSVQTGVLDRYWLLLLPVVFTLGAQLSGPKLGRLGWVASGLLLLQLTLSVAFARDFLIWNQTRWKQVEAWLAEGLAAEEIDGGRDINAWLRSAEDYQTLPRPGDTTTWWNGRARVALAIGPRDDWKEIGRLKWRAWASGGNEHEIILLRRETPEQPQ